MQRLISRMSRMRCVAHINITPVAVLSFILIIPASSPVVRAQSSTQSTREARRTDLENRQRDLWNLERAKRRPADKKRDARPAYQQVSEDFEKLQLSSYNLSGAVESVPVLNYGLIQDEAAEIRKRAARLMTALQLPEVEREQKEKKRVEELPAQDLKSNVASLDELVKSFVWNPVFQQSGLVDVENSTKARRDLEGILKLSEQIRKSAKAAGHNTVQK